MADFQAFSINALRENFTRGECPLNQCASGKSNGGFLRLTGRYRHFGRFAGRPLNRRRAKFQCDNIRVRLFAARIWLCRRSAAEIRRFCPMKSRHRPAISRII
jgi:hypothetical protein